MEYVLETAIFDEITFAKNEAVLDVIDALVVEYDKMDYIMSHTDCSDEFSIVQESFTKPKKDEGTVTKIALAVPRAIYALIKAIVDGFKNAFGKKESFMTPERIDQSFKIVNNLTKDKEFMKLACGVVVGTFAYIKLFCKNKHEQFVEARNERAEMKTKKFNAAFDFENNRRKAIENVNKMFAFYVNEDDTVGLVMFVDLHKLKGKVIDDFLRGIEDHIGAYCRQASTCKTPADFDKIMENALYDVDHNDGLFKAMGFVDTIVPKDYTFKEYESCMKKFMEANFSNSISDICTNINRMICSTYKAFESKVEEADKKEEKLTERADNKYGTKIQKILESRMTFLKEWLVLLNKTINTAIEEYNKTMKDKVEKLSPTTNGGEELDEWTTQQWMADKSEKDEVRNKAKKLKDSSKDEKPEEASKENKEEAKEEKSTEKESPEEKKDNNKKEEKESDD